MFCHDVFLAYASPDGALARQLHALLKPHCESIFLDQISLRGGERWGAELVAALEGSRVVLVLLSRHSAAAHYQLDELARACSREQRELPGRTLLPVRVEPGVPLPYGLAGVQPLDLDQGLEAVVARVVELLAPGARGPSPFVVGPTIVDDRHFFGREWETAALLRAIDRGSAVQILGERRMGKSSLLRWVERHAAPDRPTVFIDAKDAQLADAWGFLARIVEGLCQPRLVDGWQRQGLQPAQAVGLLPPCTLLVDEADGLVGELPGASLDFWVQFRVHSQGHRKVQWVSAARESLLRRSASESFRGSQFLNDATVVWAGALEEAAVVELLRGSALEAATWVWAQSGGQAMVAQALGEALWEGGSPGEALEDVVLGRLGDVVFASWWVHRTAAEQAVLRRMVRREALDRPARRTARRMVDMGLVREGEQGPEVCGGLWRAWLEEL